MPSSSIKSKLYLVRMPIKIILSVVSFPLILSIILCHLEIFESISKDSIYDWLSSVYESLLIAFSIILPLLYGFITNTKSPSTKRQAYINFKHSLFAFLLFMIMYFLVSYISHCDIKFLMQNISEKHPYLLILYNNIHFLLNNHSFTDYIHILTISLILCAGFNQIYHICKSVWQFIKQEETFSIIDAVSQQYDELKEKIAFLSQKREETLKDTSISEEDKKKYLNSIDKYISSCRNLILSNFEISNKYSKKL